MMSADADQIEQHRAERREIVRDRRPHARDAAVQRGHGRKREAVDVVDLRRAERLAWRHDLAAGRHDRDDRLRVDLDLRAADRRTGADTARGEMVARAEQRFAASDVGAARPDVLSGLAGFMICTVGRCAEPSALSVSSTMTTASDPGGSGAPVAISAHSPVPILRDGAWPV